MFNIGTGTGSSVRDVIRACEDVIGGEIAKRTVERRPGDPPALVASSEKIESELGWKPAYPNIRDVVETAWRWHRLHPHGYDSE